MQANIDTRLWEISDSVTAVRPGRPQTVDPFKNFLLNLNAPGRGPITVLIGWMFGLVALGIFGHGEIASYALGLMGILGGVLLTTMALRT
jgi:hypothetical protein